MRLDFNQLKRVKQRAESKQLTSEDYKFLEAVVGSYIEILTLLKDPNTSLDQVYEHVWSFENVAGVKADINGCDNSQGPAGDE